MIDVGGKAEATLREPAVAAVGGTWIASRSMIRDGDWTGVRRNAEAAVRIARAAREMAR